MSQGDGGSRVKLEAQWPLSEGSCSSSVSLVRSVLFLPQTSEMSSDTVVKMVYLLIHKNPPPPFPSIIVKENQGEGNSLGEVVPNSEPLQPISE